ncbi:hypothetical protein FHR71_004483 [Methylobacterium sp. RAS18]|nr:hypothetical protein [Methylobacterium sp. RAS18]
MEASQRQIDFMSRFRLRRKDGSNVWVLSAASPSFTPLTHDFVGFLGVISRYEDEAQGLIAKVEIGTFKPGRATAEFAAVSKFDLAADHLIAARALTVEYGGEVATGIDHALYALAQALRRDRSKNESLDTHH